MRPVVLAVVLVTLVAAPPARADVTVRASVRFGEPQPWQSEVEGRAEHGSWVKHSSPVIADLDPGARNGPEIVVGALNGDVVALRLNGNQLTTVWTRNVGTFVNSSPAVADLDGDGSPEVVVGAGDEFEPPSSGLYAFAADGRQLWFRATPSNPEGYNPRPAQSVGVFASPAIGDVDGDGRPDVAFSSFNHLLFVVDRNGRDLPGWERGKDMHDTLWSSPALADLNGDGRHEVIVGSDLGGGAAVLGCPKPARGTVSVFDSAARYLPGWPKCMDTPIWSTPAVQDLDGDGMLDVVVGTNNYIENNANVGNPSKAYAWDATGRPLWTASLTPGSRAFASPAVGDVDGDGRPEVAISTVPNGLGEVLLLDGATGNVRWRRDDGSPDRLIFLGSPVIADVGGSASPDVVALGGNGQLHAWDASGSRIARVGLGLHFNNSPAVADLDGDGTHEVVAASAVAAPPPSKGQVWVLSTGARGAAPWPMFKRAPDRRSSFGAGGPLPGVPGTTARPAASRAAPAQRTGAPAVAASAAPSPGPTPEPTPSPTPEPTPGESAVAAPQSTARRPLGAVGVAALAAAAASAAVIGWRRLRR